MSRTGLHHWLIALALSLGAHLALGFWLDAIGPEAKRNTTVALTVSLASPLDNSRAASPEERFLRGSSGEQPSKSAPSIEPQTTPERPAKRAHRKKERRPAKKRPQDEAVDAAEAPARPALPASDPEPVAAARRRTETFSDAQAPGNRADVGARAAAPAPGNPKPRYPSLARRRGYEGRVLIQVAIQPDGRAAHVEVKESSGHRVLDEAALAAVKDWRFSPARRAGRPVSATVAVPISFRLDDNARSL